MGLLGKTLKGKSTIPGKMDNKKNIKERIILVSKEEFENNQQNQVIKLKHLKESILNEEKIYNLNKKKLMIS